MKLTKFPIDQTYSIDSCVCPYCGHEFDGKRAINGDLDTRLINCPKCEKEMEVYPSVEYWCVAIKDEEGE